MKKILLLLIVLSFTAQAQTNRQLVLEVADETGQKKPIEFYAGSYALVIGASEYRQAGWQKLPGVKVDTAAIKQTLVRQGFTVEEITDATSETLLPRLNKFVNDYGFVPNNRLLIYFAGHGYTETDAETKIQYGYLVPVDAPNPHRDQIGFQQRAVSMDDIENVARRIRSRHALFLFDSCFSGTLISREAGGAGKFVDYLTTKPVRQFITSGAANQTVPDVSVFRQMFVKGLEGEADSNRDGYITGSELAAFLQERVIHYSKSAQTPQYGKLRDPRLDGGDFVFVLPKKEATQSASNFAANQNIYGKFISALKTHLPPAAASEKLRVGVLKFSSSESSSQGIEIAEPMQLSPTDGKYHIKLNRLFRLEIENVSNDDLYVYVIVKTPDDKMILLYPQARDFVKLLGKNQKIQTALLRTTEPVGLEIFEVIATRQPLNFSAEELRGSFERDDFDWSQIILFKEVDVSIEKD